MHQMAHTKATNETRSNIEASMGTVLSFLLDFLRLIRKAIKHEARVIIAETMAMIMLQKTTRGRSKANH